MTEQHLAQAVTRSPARRSASRFALNRGLTAALAVGVVVAGTFFALNATGNPAMLLVPADASKEEVERVTRLMGYDRPLVEQFFVFISRLATGDLPDSIRYGRSPLVVALERLPASVLLGSIGLALGMTLGLSAGWLAARSPDRVSRRLPLITLSAIDAVPSFFLGVLLIFVFGVKLRWFPIMGAGSVAHLVLPSLVLAFAIATPVARVFRSSVRDTQVLPHVRLARSKGISPWQLAHRHIAINSLSPVLNVLGTHAGLIFGGAVVVESLFGYPGIGQLAISSLNARDYPVVLVSVTLLSVGFVATSALVDVASALLDRRITL